MRCRSFALLVALGLSFTAGCGDDAKTQPGSSVAGSSGKIPADPIARVVYDFFDAVRQGRPADANRLLTPLALERINALDMNIVPPGSQTASFTVGAAVRDESDPQRAMVRIVWSDLDADGKRVSEPPLYCGLRQVGDQWRIWGMVQELGPNVEPMVMDFESLEGMAPRDSANSQGVASTAATQSAAAPSTGGATAAPAPGKEIARDPFQEPVTR
jgi:hypothetical protein